MQNENRISLCLLLMRISVFLVMFVWALDKFINPQHATDVYATFYFMKGLDPSVLYVVGALEMAILVAFLIGFQKKWTYGAVLLFHAVSTLSSFKQYLAPYDGVNIMFFAAWPMLAAAFALYSLRDMDTRWVVSKA